MWLTITRLDILLCQLDYCGIIYRKGACWGGEYDGNFNSFMFSYWKDWKVKFIWTFQIIQTMQCLMVCAVLSLEFDISIIFQWEFKWLIEIFILYSYFPFPYDLYFTSKSEQKQKAITKIRLSSNLCSWTSDWLRQSPNQYYSSNKTVLSSSISILFICINTQVSVFLLQTIRLTSTNEYSQGQDRGQRTEDLRETLEWSLPAFFWPNLIWELLELSQYWGLISTGKNLFILL